MVLLGNGGNIGKIDSVNGIGTGCGIPVKEIFKPLVTAVPAPELLVKDKDAKLSLLVEVVKMSDIFPDDNVKFPEVKVSLP